MKELLNEGISNIVYHFTTMNALKNIMLTNSINFSEANSETDKTCQDNGYHYYLSVTRQSSPDVGYARVQNNKVNGELRLPEFSYDNIVKKQITKKDKKNKYNLSYDDKGKNYGVIDNNYQYNRDIVRNSSETEDRIYSKSDKLLNVYSYIIRIDILTGENNLKVRIAFDGEKLQSMFKGKSVDYFNTKYNSGLRKASKKAKTLKEVKESPQYLMEKEWNILKYFLKEVSVTIDVDNGKTATKILKWFEKIFIHTNKGTRHLGVNMLNKGINSVLSSNLWGDLAKKYSKKNVEYSTLPVLTNTNINAILGVLYLLVPHNVDISEKINIGKSLSNTFFNNIIILDKNKQQKDLSILLEHSIAKFFTSKENEINALTTPLKKLGKLGVLMKAIEDNRKHLRNNAYPVYIAIKKLFNHFDKLNPERNSSYQIYVFNKYFNTNNVKSNRGRHSKKTMFEMDDIMEMINKTLDEITI